jgi:hypothetical protein
MTDSTLAAIVRERLDAATAAKAAVVAERADIADASHDGRRVRYVRAEQTAIVLADILAMLEGTDR